MLNVKSLLASSLLAFFSFSNAQASLIDLGVDLASADRFTFAVGNYGSLQLGSEADVYGHVAAQNMVQLASGAKVHGDTCSGFISIAPLGNIAGSQGISDNCAEFSNAGIADFSRLTTDISQANLVAQALSGLTIGSIEDNAFLNAAVSNVYHVDDLILSTGEFLTVKGTASDSIVINIAGDASIGSLAGIKLTGGIRAANVLFNLLDTKAVSNFEFGGAEINGTFLANNRSFQLGDGAKLENVRFYNNSSMQANVQVVHNPPHVEVPEPSTVLLMLAGVFILLIRANSQHG